MNILKIDNVINTIGTICKDKSCFQNCISQLRRARSCPPLTCHGGGSARGVLLMWIAAVIVSLVAVCLAPLCHADEVSPGVIVTIHGVGSFYGHSVTIDGMGSGGGDGEPSYVITNVLGVCTNCTQISVDEVRRYGLELKGHAGYGDASPEANSIIGIMNSATNTISEIIGYIDDTTSDIAKFKYYNAPSYSSTYVDPVYAQLTNDCANGSIGTQGDLVNSYNGAGLVTSGSPNVNTKRVYLSYANGIYDYGHSLLNSGYGLSYWRYILDGENNHLSTLETTARQIDGVADILLAAEECRGQPDYYVPTSPPEDGGSGGNDTACLEQLQTLTEIVVHIDNDMHKHLDTINTISNNVFKIEKNLDEYGKQVVNALYPDSLGFPEDTDWKEIYYSQRPTPDYNPTNILQRIELLLYGNVAPTNFVADGDMDDEPDSVFTSVQSSLDSLSSDNKESADDAETLGDSLIGFFSQFQSLVGQPLQDGAELIPEFTVDIGNAHYTTPAVVVPTGTSRYFVAFCQVLRYIVIAFCSIVFLYSFYRYWSWFAQQAIRFSKWAIDLLTGIFA